MTLSTKRCSSIFDLDPLTPKIYSPKTKICTKSPISRLVWQIDRRCLAYQGVFGDGRFKGTVQSVVGPILVAMATKFRLGAEIQSPTGLLYVHLYSSENSDSTNTNTNIISLSYTYSLSLPLLLHVECMVQRVVTARVQSCVNNGHNSCDSGICVLNYCLEWDNTHLSHSRQ